MKKMTNPFIGSDNVGGLYVKDGRLINDRADGETGIAQAARIRRAVNNDRKINRIAYITSKSDTLVSNIFYIDTL